jgi:hypothetical protein
VKAVSCVGRKVGINIELYTPATVPIARLCRNIKSNDGKATIPLYERWKVGLEYT